MKIYCDCKTNGATQMYGYIVTDERGRVLEDNEYHGNVDSVVFFSEALALSAGLKYAELGGDIYSDNLGLVQTINKALVHGLPWNKYKNRRLLNVLAKILAVVKSQKNNVKWVRREANPAGIKRGLWLASQRYNIPKTKHIPIQNLGILQNVPITILSPRGIHRILFTLRKFMLLLVS